MADTEHTLPDAVTWVWITDTRTDDQHMLEFDGAHSQDEAPALIIRDYPDRWPTEDTFKVIGVEPGEVDQ